MYHDFMRTTVSLEPDVAAELDRVRRSEGIGLSEAINRLVRSGMAAPREGKSRFVQRTAALGSKIDLTNVAEVLELLDEC